MLLEFPVCDNALILFEQSADGFNCITRFNDKFITWKRDMSKHHKIVSIKKNNIILKKLEAIICKLLQLYVTLLLL